MNSNPDTDPDRTDDQDATPDRDAIDDQSATSDQNATDADETRTLTVRVGSADQTRQEALDRVQAAERGDDLEERHVLNFDDVADLARLVSETNLELLRAIAEHEPTSMRQVEEIVERDHKEVHRNLTELEAMGVVEFVEEGRAKRPMVRFDELEITIPVRRADDEDAQTADGAVAADESESSTDSQHSEV